LDLGVALRILQDRVNKSGPVFEFCFFFFKQKTAYEIGLGIPAEPLFRSQTQNQRYGSSHIGATAKDISNVVTDAASGVVDIFHGIDKAVADTWNNFWKDGKADGI